MIALGTATPSPPQSSHAPEQERAGGKHIVAGAASLPSGLYDAGQASDDELLSRLAQGRGRETALPELFRRHGDTSLRLAVRILGDWQAAEESVQDAFLRLAEKAPLWRGDAGFRTFFTQILVNVCRNRRRRGHDALTKGKVEGRASVQLRGLAASSRVTEVAKKMQAEETRQLVRAAIDKLPEKYREVLVLRELEGLSYKEIAGVLNASLDEVRIWIYRGRNHLRGILEGTEI